VAIDEVQRIPELLNTVHKLIETKGIKFLLTGSSARKLKRGGANLLAGRAHNNNLFPLTYHEISETQDFSLERYLTHGGLPTAYDDDDPWDYLFTYVDTYIKEEIQAEALTRNLPNFVRFLEQSALQSSLLINFSKLGNDAQISPNTARDYFQILEDTLLGFQLPPWTKSKKRKAIQTAKMYLFDCGATNALRRVTNISPGTEYFGMLFEQFICNELRAYLSYSKSREKLCYWRSKSQMEVDFIIGDSVAIETKASKKTGAYDQKGLKAISEEETQWNRRVVVSLDPISKTYENGIEHLYWKDFLNQLWSNQITTKNAIS